MHTEEFPSKRHDFAKKKFFRNLGIVLAAVAVVAYFVIPISQKNRLRVQSLFMMKPDEIQTFRLYPKVGTPYGTPKEFTVPDPLIDEFFQAISDHQSYPLSRDSAEEGHSWFIEVADHEQMLQLSCYIPYQKGEIAVVMFGDFSETSHSYYGTFQSHLLYQWFQTHSPRWLAP